MKIELPKNWKEIAGLKDITYQRPQGSPQSLQQHLRESVPNSPGGYDAEFKNVKNKEALVSKFKSDYDKEVASGKFKGDIWFYIKFQYRYYTQAMAYSGDKAATLEDWARIVVKH